MKLELSGEEEVAATVERVWERLLDPEFVAACAPGVESVEAVGAEAFRVVAGLGVGPIRLRFTLDAQLFDLEPPRSAGLRARGRAPGSNVDVSSRVQLEPTGPRTTRLAWMVESHAMGTIASVGARLLETSVRSLARAFWRTFADRVAAHEAA